MARERMAKLIKYDHFEARISHIITYFVSFQIFHHQHVSRDLGKLKQMHYKGACPYASSDQILVVLSSSFQDTELYIISRRGPKMSLIHEDYVLQNLNQSAELHCLPASRL